ncbi:hypothetical protein AwWohl_06710 [Gammaproteobacteria bacterium]|nr:hypothetical protein AwWohl_06710 [Gammaproteobacteria bacterium]
MKFTSIAPMEIDLKKVDITDPFWSEYQHLIKDIAIPYQWGALNDAIPDIEASHSIENFKIAAAKLENIARQDNNPLEKEAEFYDMVFQDSDLAKWLEAVAYSLCKYPDAALEQTADETIELIIKAQHKDGYINTYFTVKEPDNRWTNLAECHELYCAGHLIEAAVAYFNTTGKRRFLDAMCRFVDYIDTVFGLETNKLQGYPGHPEIELALMRLYEVTGNERYQSLARYFVEQRGANYDSDQHYYAVESRKRLGVYHYDHYGPAWMSKDRAYSQAHLPISDQKVAVGHAVRFVYLYTGVAHLARLSADKDKIETCKRLWNNMTCRQMYITGAIGAQGRGESFTSDYDLPNDTAYTETCASIGLIMFANRMMQLEPDRIYTDVMERALYNTVLAGMALDGKHFFYVNPLEVSPKHIPHNHIYDHVKPVRQRWFSCACCPPNIARIISSLGQYIYTQKDKVIYTNLYIASQTKLTLNNEEVTLTMACNYPWEEQISLKVACQNAVEYTIALRLPLWCKNPSIAVNGQKISLDKISLKGYAHITREWKNDDHIELTLKMEVLRVKSHPKLRQNIGKIAISRGPLVYCLEQADNGEDLHQLSLARTATFALIKGVGALTGKTLLQTTLLKEDANDDEDNNEDNDALYILDSKTASKTPQPAVFVPYFAWGNRGIGEMRVWVDDSY